MGSYFASHRTFFIITAQGGEKGGITGKWWVEARGIAKLFTMLKEAPTTKDSSSNIQMMLRLRNCLKGFTLNILHALLYNMFLIIGISWYLKLILNNECLIGTCEIIFGIYLATKECMYKH